jgi:hypothetical protein
MLKSASIDIFRDLVSEYDAAYRSASEETVLSDAKELLGLSNNVMESTLEFKTINKEELKETFLSDLALHYLQDTSTEDPIILDLITEAALFQPYLEEARLFSQAFTRVQRKANKRVLQEMEEELEAEELFHAFNRLHRKENKALLQTFEANKRTGTYYSHQPSNIDQHETNNNPTLDHPKQRNATQWVLRIAAILLLIAIPAGILRVYFMGDSNKGSTNTAENDPKKNHNPSENDPKKNHNPSENDPKENHNPSENDPKKNHNPSEIYSIFPNIPSDYFASGLVEVKLPKASEQSINLVTNSKSMGYANTETKFELKTFNLEPQISYLQKREKEINSRINTLKNKSFNHKKSTLDSLNSAIGNIKSMVEQIQLKSGTYSLRNHCLHSNCCHGKVVELYFFEQKDLNQMKVLRYYKKNPVKFYLYMDNKYYELSGSQGQLIQEKNENIICFLKLLLEDR